MPTSTRDAEAVAREHEIAALHPGATPKHLLAPLSTRIVLRSFEKAHDERELAIFGESILTAVVADEKIWFYAGSEPVWLAGTLAVDRVAGIENVYNIQARNDVWPVVRITGRLADDSLFDLEFQVFDLVDGELEHVREIDAEVAWWADATKQ